MGFFNTVVNWFIAVQTEVSLLVPVGKDNLYSCDKASCLFGYYPFPHLYG